MVTAGQLISTVAVCKVQFTLKSCLAYCVINILYGVMNYTLDTVDKFFCITIWFIHHYDGVYGECWFRYYISLLWQNVAVSYDTWQILYSASSLGEVISNCRFSIHVYLKVLVFYNYRPRNEYIAIKTWEQYYWPELMFYKCNGATN